MLDRTTFGRCADLGLPSGMAGYVQGRLGVMGDVSADEAADAAFFFERGLVTAGWETDCDLTRCEGGAAGVDPMGMVLAVDGERFTAMHGYQDLSAGPQDEATRLTVDSATDLANGTDFDVLTADERAELVSVAESAVAHTA